MGFNNRRSAIVSLAAGYALTAWQRRRDPVSAAAASALPVFLSVFVAVWTAQLLAWFVWSCLLYPLYFSPLRHLPEPSGNEFLFGQFRRILREPSGAPAIDWINTIPHNGLIRYLSFFNHERILLASPKALAEVLVLKNDEFIKPAHVRNSLSPVLGNGVLLAEGDEHRFQRKQLMPAFAFRHVKDLYPVFWRKGRESVAAMRVAARTQPSLNASDWASRATLDIIGLAGFGRDFGALQNPDDPISQTYRKIFAGPTRGRVPVPLIMLMPRWLLRLLRVKRLVEVEAAGKFLRETGRQIVAEKKARLEQKKGQTEATGNIDSDILSVAVESGAFSDELLVDQLLTFLAAGHETTASSMCWAIYLLCAHPEVQSRLRAEIRAHLPPLGEDAEEAKEQSPKSPPRDATAVDIDRLPYLNAVCSEVLRYFAPVPLTVREAAVDTSILGQAVPQGTQVMLVPWAVNKSVAMWGADALEFKPERWLRGKGGNGRGEVHGEGESGSSNYAFLTFLHGPRSCIGMHFARAEFACLLAAWVGRFEFRLRDAELLDEAKLDIRGTATARLFGGLHVHASLVEGW